MGIPNYAGLGDAARAVNPILSQGVTLAAEDAYVLGRCLRGVGGGGGGEGGRVRREVIEGVAEFERERQRRMFRLNVAGKLVDLVGGLGEGASRGRDWAMGMWGEGRGKRRVFEEIMNFSLGPRVRYGEG